MTDEDKRSEEQAQEGALPDQESDEASSAELSAEEQSQAADESNVEEVAADAKDTADESSVHADSAIDVASNGGGDDDDRDKNPRDDHDGHGHAHGNGDHHGHVHGGDRHGGHDDHIGHTAPMSLLIGVLVALSMLTVLTVAVTAIDLGSQGNFVIAMVIATIKAILVMGYFMHMFWDSKFNVVAFTSSFLFVLLFLGMAVLDRAEYQNDVNLFENDEKSQM